MAKLSQSMFAAALLACLAWFCSEPAFAQTALCPPSVGTQTGFALSKGTCTNGFTGAFSGAALATQALSDLSQSATQETVRNTANAISTRRDQEQERCPDGFRRVNGLCEPIAAPARSPAPVAQPQRAKRFPAVAGSKREPRMAPRKPAPTYAVAAPPPPPVYPAPFYQSRFGAWAQGFGSYEDRSASETSTIVCCTNVPATGGAGLPIGLTIDQQSRSNTIGFLGGVDYTTRGMANGDDGLIFGVLTGYTSSDFRLKTSSISSVPGNVGNGFGTLKATLSGPAAGFYVTYFAGRFSADLTFKADLYDLDERFTDNLAFTVNLDGAGNPVNTGVNSFTGRSSGGLTNLSTFGNISYRLFTIGPVWVEPTVGFQYTESVYDNRAKRRLGLNDGDLVMIQGGARLGMDTIFADQSRLTTTLTGLAYDDVEVNGGFIQGGLFGSNLLAKTDEGEVRGRGILALNYAVANGVSLFAQGDVYGGERLFGAGGKGGVRVEW